MDLKKTSVLVSISTAVQMLSTLIINKAISLLIGPSGLAMIGQFNNVQGIVRIIAQGGINTGVTKYTAEFKDQEKRDKLWSTSFYITLFCTVVISILTFVFSEHISEYTFKSKEYGYIFLLLSSTLILYSLNQLCLSVVNGVGEVKTYIVIKIAQSLFALVLTLALVYVYKLHGSIVALVLGQSIAFVILFFILRKNNRFKLKVDVFSTIIANKLFRFSLMRLTTAVSVPISLLLVRSHLTSELSVDSAGYWQSMYYISTMYLSVITTALSVYYLPKISSIQLKSEIRKELYEGYKLVVPFLIISCTSIYLLKEFIVNILFSSDFTPMLVLFKWQLFADIIRVCAWLLSYLLVAKAKTKLHIFNELLYAILFVTLNIIFVDWYGLVGASYASFLISILYLTSIGVSVRKIIY
ncbi:lipopolysaccharide biosynthesis protein [Vibrio breoganii]|uniref:O-antigen translocase n=1 Tax=Vibrio breoganii TaxID=553239 RepID=UPI000C83AFC4|nr:O-antigen translocase [Vibrio breoganii]PMG02420.1 lipopolysaccharide biosynthesis protein [Vibrio breoganii]